MAGFFYGFSAFTLLLGASIFITSIIKSQVLAERDLRMMGNTGCGFMAIAMFMFFATMFGQWMGGY